MIDDRLTVRGGGSFYDLQVRIAFLCSRAPIEWGIIIGGRRLSVRLSVSCMTVSQNGRAYRIGRNEAHGRVTCDPI